MTLVMIIADETPVEVITSIGSFYKVLRLDFIKEVIICYNGSQSAQSAQRDRRDRLIRYLNNLPNINPKFRIIMNHTHRDASQLKF